MKYVIGVVLFFWLLTGLIGAKILGDLDTDHWKLVAKGPFTLAKAVDEKPVTYPSGD
jgi:hypothetical protein